MAKIYQERQERAEHRLLTKAIPKDEDGAYRFHYGVWLSQHEVLRREFLRLQRVMKTIDPITYPWKALCLKVWLSEFLVPTCLLYEENKRNIWYSVYESKDIIVADHLKRDAAFLTANATQVIALSHDLFNLVNTVDIYRIKIVDKIKDLSIVIDAFINQQLSLFDSEELFWPPIFLNLKIETWNEVLLKQMKLVVGRSDSIGTTQIAAVMHYIGYNLKVLQNEDELDIPWAGPWTRMDITHSVPFLIRAMPLATWMKRYMHYKNMINSLQGDEDVMELEASDYTRTRMKSNCRCIIS